MNINRLLDRGITLRQPPISIMHQSEITRLYKGVIEDVIKNVRNDFVNMGVDEQVLYDLQLLWEQKLMDYKIVSPAEYFGNNTGNLMMAPNGPIMGQFSPQRMMQQQHQLNSLQPHDSLNVLANGAIAAAPQPTADSYGYIKPNPSNRNTYYHPSQGYFEAASSGVAPPSAANLPSVAPYNNNKDNNNVKPQQPPSKQNPRRYDGAGDSIEEPGKDASTNEPDDIMKLLYTNGDEEIVLDKGKGSDSLSLPTQTPVNEEEDDEINSDLDDDDDDDDKDVDGEGYDESGTMDENVVLCQYEKVSRTRNKWRCVFKSGIIHVNGADYVFSKANGEFEW